jgi:hypothetical protein
MVTAVLAFARNETRVFDLCGVIAGIATLSLCFTLLESVIVVALEPFAAGYLATDMQLGFVLGLLAFLWLLVGGWWLGRVATSESPKRLGLWPIAAILAADFILPSHPIVDGRDANSERFDMLQYAEVVLRSASETDSAPRLPPIDVEATYARQPQLIEAALAAMKSSGRGHPEVYFVGVAGYAGQDVFKREVTQTKEILGERFGTRERSVLLVNNRETVAELPLASVTNLEAVLTKLGRIMDIDKDFLFLFLTSHGSEGVVSVSFPRFSLNDLTPERLAGMLQRSGIKNRIIIISACHSGSFIPALQDPGTVVMTAARADRTSFGCSDEREWTYFGDALFNRALRSTYSLTEGFDIAKATIGEWEATEHLTPSEPQIFVGEVIRPKLEVLAKRLLDQGATFVEKAGPPQESAEMAP